MRADTSHHHARPRRGPGGWLLALGLWATWQAVLLTALYRASSDVGTVVRPSDELAAGLTLAVYTGAYLFAGIPLGLVALLLLLARSPMPPIAAAMCAAAIGIAVPVLPMAVLALLA